MDQSEGMPEGAAEGATGVRLCTLDAQGEELAREEFKQEVERNLTGRESERWEILYFKAYESQLPVSEQAPKNSGAHAREQQISRVVLGYDLRGLSCWVMQCVLTAGSFLANRRLLVRVAIR